MKDSWKIFFIELIFFLATLILGVVLTCNLGKVMNDTYAVSTSDINHTVSPFWFIAYFLLATAVIFFISKSQKLEKERITFFKVAFIFSVLVGSMFSLAVFLGDFFAFLLIVMLLILWQKKPIILLHNLLIVFAIAGIGVIVGMMFQPFVIVGFLIFFSVYDFIAVYKTKHMVKMATEMIKTKAIMGLIIPFSFQGLFDDLDKKKKKEFMVLGGGDVAFPLFLIVSVILQMGLEKALILVFFACLGLFSSFYLFITQKINKPIPALPPIAICCIIGFLIISFL